MVLTTRRQARLQDLSQDVGETNTTVETDAGSSKGEASLSPKKRTASAAADSSSASSSASSGEESSEDEDDNDSESDSQTSSNIDDEEEADIDKLFEESLKACHERDRAAAASSANLSAFETSADQILLGASGNVKGKEKDILGDIATSQTKKRSDESYEAFFDRLKRGDDLGGQKPKTESQLYRERQKEREKTAGSKWFDMPAFPKSTSTSAGAKGSKKGQQHQLSASSPTAEEMTRQVQAIRLRNAMDPKRFYRGGNGVTEKGMPAFAQMGRIISSNLEPASTMSRSERGRTVIDELVKDAQNAAYTKRKFNEQQARTDVGRSSHISKRNSRNSGKKQKQRR